MKSNSKNKLFFLLSIIILIIAFSFVFVNSFAEKTVTVSNTDTVKMFTDYSDCDPNLLPYYVASQNGYFTDAKIDITMTSDNTSARTLSKPATFASDLVMIGRATFYEIEDKKPDSFKGFSIQLQDESHSNDAVIIRKDSNITSFAQLKGKTIGITMDGERGSPAGIGARIEVMKAILINNSLNPNDFNIVVAVLEDLNDKKVDALYIREPLLGISMHLGATKVLESGPIFAKYEFSPWPMEISGFSPQFLKSKPEVAKKIIQVWDKSIDYIRANPDTSVKILQDCVRNNYWLFIVHIQPLVYWKHSEIDRNLIQKQVDWYYSIGYLSRKLNVNDFLLTGS